MKYFFIVLFMISATCCAQDKEQQHSVFHAPLMTRDFRYDVSDVAHANQKISSWTASNLKCNGVRIYVVPQVLYYDIVIIASANDHTITQSIIDEIRKNVQSFLDESRKTRRERPQDDPKVEAEKRVRAM